MTSLFDKLNLRPQERRLIVIVGAIIFFLLNLWFVWPSFGEWDRVQRDLNRSRATLQAYKSEVEQTPAYRAKLDELQSVGTEVATEQQALQLQRIVQTQAAGAGVGATGFDPIPSARSVEASRFFDEQTVTVRFTNTRTKELVTFLSSLAAGSSVIWIKGFDLKTDRVQMNLEGWVTFVASYQKPVPAGGPTAATSRRKS